MKMTVKLNRNILVTIFSLSVIIHVTSESTRRHGFPKKIFALYVFYSVTKVFLITILLVRSSANKVRRSGTKGVLGETPNRKYTDLSVCFSARKPREHDGNVREKEIRKVRSTPSFHPLCILCKYTCTCARI